MKTIVTLTTIPNRLKSKYGKDIRYCLNSLVNQNNSDYEVHFNVPNIYNRTGEQYILPDWIEDYTKLDNFKLYRTTDHGSATKLIPTIERVKEDDTVIIVVDDDMIYHPELVNEHLKNREKWPNYAVAYDGMRSRKTNGEFSNYFGDSRDYYYSATKMNSLVDILQHYSSVSYYRHFFKDDFFDFWDEHKVWCDDTAISAYMASKHIGRLVTYYDKDEYEMRDGHYKILTRHHFPIIEDTQHDSNEGCNLNRQDNKKEDHEKIGVLYKILDYAYHGKEWEL